MSGKNNVNPDHYKVAGRDRPNEVLGGEPRLHDEIAHAAPAKGRPARNFIPGALPVGEAPAPRTRAAAAKPAGRASGGAARRASATSAKPSAKRTRRSTATTARKRQVRKRQPASTAKRPAKRTRRTAA